MGLLGRTGRGGRRAAAGGTSSSSQPHGPTRRVPRFSWSSYAAAWMARPRCRGGPPGLRSPRRRRSACPPLGCRRGGDVAGTWRLPVSLSRPPPSPSRGQRPVRAVGGDPPRGSGGAHHALLPAMVAWRATAFPRLSPLAQRTPAAVTVVGVIHPTPPREPRRQDRQKKYRPEWTGGCARARKEEKETREARAPRGIPRAWAGGGERARGSASRHPQRAAVGAPRARGSTVRSDDASTISRRQRRRPRRWRRPRRGSGWAANTPWPRLVATAPTKPARAVVRHPRDWASCEDEPRERTREDVGKMGKVGRRGGGRGGHCASAWMRPAPQE